MNILDLFLNYNYYSSLELSAGILSWLWKRNKIIWYVLHHVTIILIIIQQTKELQVNMYEVVVGKVSLDQILLYNEHFISDFI